MPGSEAKNSEVWQGKGSSDFWCWEAAVERSQRIPFELPMGILVLSVTVAKWRQVYAYGSCDRITNDHYRRYMRTRYRVTLRRGEQRGASRQGCRELPRDRVRKQKTWTKMGCIGRMTARIELLACKNRKTNEICCWER